MLPWKEGNPSTPRWIRGVTLSGASKTQKDRHHMVHSQDVP